MKRKFSSTIGQRKVGVQYGNAASARMGRATRHSRQRRHPAAAKKRGKRKMGQTLAATANVSDANAAIHGKEIARRSRFGSGMAAPARASTIKQTATESLCPLPQNSISGSGDQA